MTLKDKYNYETIFKILIDSEDKDEFLDRISPLLDEIFKSKSSYKHNLDTLYEDDWWTCNIS